jgi:hypothetical protein
MSRAVSNIRSSGILLGMRDFLMPKLNAFRIGLAEFWQGYMLAPSGC